jgi:CarD family transcriptional regulator
MVRVGRADMARNMTLGKGGATKVHAKKHLAKSTGRSATSAKVAHKGLAGGLAGGQAGSQAGKAEAKRPAKAARPPAKKAPATKTATGNPVPAKAVAKTAAKTATVSNGSRPVTGKAMAAAHPPSPAADVRVMPAPGKPTGGAPATSPKPPAEKPGATRQSSPPPAQRKPVNQRHGFKTNEWIVYPSHGVGRIVGIEEQEIAGMSLELFVITFEKDKMTLRVPTGKSSSVGMRKLAEEGIVKRAMETLKGRARIKRTMWSRRAQEYEAKINSGDLIAIAEVVRDLYRSESQPEQSYSERQLYEAALDRMAREIAAVEKLDERGATQRITEVLAKSAKGRRIAAEETEVKAA